MSFQGSLLVASPLLVEPTFHRTVVLILEHNKDGAMGLILNRPSEERVADHLPGWAAAESISEVVYLGGPVEPEVAIGLTNSPTGSPTVVPGLATIDLELPPPADLRTTHIYSGYSGWSGGQLEAEVVEGAWYVVEAAPDDPFDTSGDFWSQVLKRQSGRLAMLAHYPTDPELN